MRFGSEPAPKNEPESNQPQKATRAGKATKMALVGLAGIIAVDAATEFKQESVNAANAKPNHAFSISELPLTDKIRHLIGTTSYTNKYTEGLSKSIPTLANILREASDAGLIHLYSGELQSAAEAKEHIAQLREKNPTVLISVDFEGGLVNHFKLTADDLIDFGFPEALSALKQSELTYYKRETLGSLLPSQEWLGRVYSKLQTTGEKKEFLDMMTAYGVAVGKLCQHVGINLVLGPNLDIVKDIDGQSPDERNDRSFGQDSTLVAQLGISYMRGVSQVAGVMPVAKHFIGNSLSSTDPHHKSANANIGPKSGALLPFRDVINEANEFSKERVVLLETQITALVEKNNLYQAEIDQTKDVKTKRRRQLTIAANLTLIESSQKEIESLKSHTRSGFEMGVMTATTSNNLYDKNVPSLYSDPTLSLLSGDKINNGFGHKDLIMTDDLSMESAIGYIEKMRVQSKSELDPLALSLYQALGSGNHIAFMRHLAGNEIELAKSVATFIENQVDADRDGEADLSIEKIDTALSKVLDLKVHLGLLTKENINGEDHYVMDPRLYNPSVMEVLEDSLFSNQWPWISKDSEPLKEQPAAGTLLMKAAKNFVLSLWRVNVQSVSPKYAEAENEKQPLVVIDKSARYMWLYDPDSGQKLEGYEIGIGKGGLKERRFLGDHTTPTGTYQVVQKRDDQWWRENKGAPLPKDYGGIDGGMLVLAGPWHPEIAIHGTAYESVGDVSNGCVRTINDDIQHLLDTIPLGTLVVITR